jgi:hypothetical protein
MGKFKTGDRLICISESPFQGTPKYGAVYTFVEYSTSEKELYVKEIEDSWRIERFTFVTPLLEALV